MLFSACSAEVRETRISRLAVLVRPALILLLVSQPGCGSQQVPSSPRAPEKRSPSVEGNCATTEASTSKETAAKEAEQAEVARLQDLAKQRPGEAEVQLALGVAQAKAGDLEAAAAQFKKMIKLAPKDFRGYYNLGQILMRQELPDRAISPLARARQLAAERPALWLALVQAQRRAGKPQAALSTLKQACLKLPQDPQLLMQLGLSLEQAHLTREAEQTYAQLIDLAPRHRQALRRLGLLRVARGDSEAAVEPLKRAVALGATDGESEAQLGIALLRLERPGEAVPHLRRATAALPNDGQLRMNFGLALERTGQDKEALEAYKQAKELLPSSAEARLRLAVLEAAIGSVENAQAVATAALRLKKTVRPALDQAIEKLAQENHLSAALALTDAILAVLPQDKIAQHNRRVLNQMRERK